VIASDVQKPLYFQKLYEGNYRPRWEVSYLQVQETKGNNVFRPASLRAVDGKPISDDSAPYEIAPGKHQLDYACLGKDKQPDTGSTVVEMQPGHVYELEKPGNAGKYISVDPL
jgi:hypothetical protein